MNIFGIGYQEIAVILVVALIVFGPTRLPEVAGQAARWIRDARKMMTDLSGEFERNAGVNEFKTAIQGEIAGVKRDLEEAGVSVKKDLNAAANTANSAVKGAAGAAKGTTTKPKPKTATTSSSLTKASPSVVKAKPKASKADPYAGLVALTEATPKVQKAVSIAASNGNGASDPKPTEPIRETSEAVMRARERRLSAGYNRRISAT